MFTTCSDCCRRGRCRRPGGFSLVEVMVVLTVIGILVAMAAPSFHRSIEQSRADIAAANLRAVWAAQRLYWLDQRTFAADIATLSALGILEPEATLSLGGFSYTIRSATATAFVAAASRASGGAWTGELTIDETGEVTGVLQRIGQPDITVGFQ